MEQNIQPTPQGATPPNTPATNEPQNKEQTLQVMQMSLIKQCKA
ncbi:hypothetical protein [Helicobacter cinaedi]|nr:hypothetical protein [Helicobacter cinaedi]